jgi:hypothetical protein
MPLSTLKALVIKKVASCASAAMDALLMMFAAVESLQLLAALLLSVLRSNPQEHV